MFTKQSTMKAAVNVMNARSWFLTALLLVFLEISCAQPNAGLQCHLCGAGEPARLCNSTSNIIQCGNNEICFTQVDNTPAGLTTRKGCIESQQCERYRNRNDHMHSDDLCPIGVVRSRCTWCCADDNCNYDRFKYSHTTPRPTLRPDPALTTHTALSTVTPPTCDVKDFTKCITKYSNSVDKVLEDPRDNFPEFCQNVPDVFLCIMDSVEECCHGDKTQIDETLKSVTTALLHACPGECSPVGAADCTSDVIENSCTEILTSASGDPCTLLIKEYFKYEHCITFNTGVCTEEEKVTQNTTVSLIKREIDLICNDTTTPTVPPTRPGTSTHRPYPTRPPVTPSTRPPVTTESPNCRPDLALRCLKTLGKSISKYLTGTGDLDHICKDKIPETEECISATTDECSEGVKEKIQTSYSFVIHLIGDQCLTGPTTPAPKCDTLAARQCVTKLYGLIDEADDFQSACEEVEQTKECLDINTAACTQEEKDSLQDFLKFVLNRIGDRCDSLIQADCNRTLTLVEGGPEEKVTFTFQRDPKDICAGQPDCKVFVDVFEETGKQPKCKDGKVISQLVVRQDGKATATDYCSIEITPDNWRDQHQFIVAAKIDLKYDGNQTRVVHLVYRKVIGGRVRETRTVCTLTVVVVDRDSQSRCISINDPHMTTFDGHYYNNYYEGVFTLYKHKYLPYEVQAIFQRCNKKATCNCGVAVKSGDFVFFADRCRRKAVVCDRRNRRKGCGDLLETYTFEWDNIPQGTRIFRNDGGRTFVIMLPHGTMIKIKLSGKSFMNVVVIPSPYDWGNTEGLCGTYDGNKRNDLQLPDGTLYRGKGTGRAGQPKGFSLAWRVEREDIIYHGVAKDPFYPESYCESRSDPMHASRSQCVCSRNMENLLVETCDLDTSGEIRYDIHPSIQTNDQFLPKGRIRRQALQGQELQEYDIDLDFVPPENIEAGSDWTRREAEEWCKAYLEDTFEFAQLCLKEVPNISDKDQLLICVEDIMITGETVWAFSALDDLQDACLQQVNRNTTFTQTPWGRNIADKVAKSTCINNCNNRGQCENGKCVCNAGWTDIDCGFPSDATPEFLSLSQEGLCSTRHTNCSVAVVFGQQFNESDKLTCHLQKIKVTSEGTETLPERLTVPGVYFTLNQVLCLLPSATDPAFSPAQSYLVDVSNDGLHPSQNARVFVPHDPVCHECLFTDTNSVACTRRTSGNCLIGESCFAEGEKDSEKSCNICDPDKSTSEWSSDCSSFLPIVAAIFVILAIVAIAAVIVCCICCRRKREAAREKQNQTTYYSSLQVTSNETSDGMEEKPVKLTVR